MYATSQQNVENLTASFGKTPCFSSTPEINPHYFSALRGQRGTPEPYLINEEAVIKEEDVHCHSCKKDHPDFGKYCPAGGRTATREPGVINEEAVQCRSCQKDHATFAFNYCPRTPCTTCFKTGHIPFDCPYLRKIPKDVEFDRAKYEITCQCGNLFDVDKWICTWCPRVHPLLKRKYCTICREFTQHSYYECPKDTARAAVFKSCRDHLLSKPARFPCVGEEEASTS